MKKEYWELFNEVHASERLRTEVMNMKHEETKRIQRIPRAMLAAAALVFVLAGTAVAAEHFGWLKSVRPVEPGELLTDNAQAGYQTKTVYDKIPIEALTPEALAWITSVSEAGEHAYDTKSFDTWQDVENFLGLELADHALLEGMGTKDPSSGRGVICSSGDCLVMSEGMTGLTEVLSRYQDGEYEIMQTALLQFACPGQEGGSAALTSRIESMGGFRTESYQTSDGLEAVLFVEENTVDAGSNIYASFPHNGTLFIMCVKGSSVEGAMEEMQLILDAYE
ncbi:MAG: hypothetical protein K2O45_05605 [Oscillospiraceae bacterium]|nr:hypothetical protein [Oscillospiraceae bacterium]